MEVENRGVIKKEKVVTPKKWVVKVIYVWSCSEDRQFIGKKEQKNIKKKPMEGMQKIHTRTTKYRTVTIKIIELQAPVREQ